MSFRQTNQELVYIQNRIAKVTGWILGPAERLLNRQYQVGYDVQSAEELRRSHDELELRCWEAYGIYAEIVNRMDTNETDESTPNSDHTRSEDLSDIRCQKEFMDFVCRSFAYRLERRRNILITSVRFFRLSHEYCTESDHVFGMLKASSRAALFDSAAQHQDWIKVYKRHLDLLEWELSKEGEKLCDMLSMPVKDALGRELQIDYGKEVRIIQAVLEVSHCRKAILDEGLELQRLTLMQAKCIDDLEQDAMLATLWLQELLELLLTNHAYVGNTIEEIRLQKIALQSIHNTAKDSYYFGQHLCDMAMELRESCKMPTDDTPSSLNDELSAAWYRIHNACQEQMSRLRVSAGFFRNSSEHCNQLRTLREYAATIPLMELARKKELVQNYIRSRDELLVDVGRTKRFGELLRNRLSEPLLCDTMQPTQLNEDAVEAITEQLTEMSNLVHQLDQALENAQLDCSMPLDPEWGGSIQPDNVICLIDECHTDKEKVEEDEKTNDENEGKLNEFKTDDILPPSPDVKDENNLEITRSHSSTNEPFLIEDNSLQEILKEFEPSKAELKEFDAISFNLLTDDERLLRSQHICKLSDNINEEEKVKPCQNVDETN